MDVIAFILSGGAREGWDGLWWIFPPLFLVLWLSVIAAVVWFASRRRFRREPIGFDVASGVLAERFARGEISHDEYTERLRQLRESS